MFCLRGNFVGVSRAESLVLFLTRAPEVLQYLLSAQSAKPWCPRLSRFQPPPKLGKFDTTHISTNIDRSETLTTSLINKTNLNTLSSGKFNHLWPSYYSYHCGHALFSTTPIQSQLSTIPGFWGLWDNCWIKLTYWPRLHANSTTSCQKNYISAFFLGKSTETQRILGFNGLWTRCSDFPKPLNAVVKLRLRTPVSCRDIGQNACVPAYTFWKLQNQ